MDLLKFSDLLREKGHDLYRDMPWRQDTRPYYVLVSELMLQQTQVDRVIPKFHAFIKAFPDEKALAAASLADVIRLWSGLGYNRRAKYLHDVAKKIVSDGKFPDNLIDLQLLPGVGKNTAGAIMTYSFNQSVVFVETNVRSVYLHHFFPTGELVDDKQIIALVERTIDHDNPREFYWALMDYGSWLKRRGAGKLQQSRHYKKQSPLKGSVREVRGQIIHALAKGDMTASSLRKSISADERFQAALDGLISDGLVSHQSELFHLTK